ncbi:MAG: LrgB family protein [Rikenellaceae bacterium]|nr:LrgB family protein [Rikenellaceae bacterium]
METFLQSHLLWLTLTLAVYAGSSWIFSRLHLGILHPLLVSTVAMISLLKLSGVSYETYAESTDMISFMLGPAVVSLGYVLYQQIDHIKRNVTSILVSTFAGSVVGVASVIGILRLTGADEAVIASIAPKSVTTPIAIQLSEHSGGIASLTSMAVVICGIFGAVAAPYMFKIFRISSPVARGLAFGSSAHGVGTAAAVRMGAVEGAISGLAIGVMGVMTALALPLVSALMRYID